MFTVGVKFCGNCNPQVNTVALLQKIKESLPEAKFVSWEKEAKDALLILNGCPVGCALRPDFKGPTVVVAGHSVDRKSVKTDDLLFYVNEKIKKK